MICLECRGTGTAIYYCETARDENSVTMKKVEDICHSCHGSGRKPETNAERIRSMSDEELANVLTDFSNNGGWVTEIGRQICYERIIGWLEQPAEEV